MIKYREATFTEEQKAAFYKEIPIFMHYFPHLYIFRQQATMMQKQQEEAEAQKEMMGEMQKSMKSYFSSEEGIQKVNIAIYLMTVKV
jgi:hypothetical protein